MSDDVEEGESNSVGVVVGRKLSILPIMKRFAEI